MHCTIKFDKRMKEDEDEIRQLFYLKLQCQNFFTLYDSASWKVSVTIAVINYLHCLLLVPYTFHQTPWSGDFRWWREMHCISPDLWNLTLAWRCSPIGPCNAAFNANLMKVCGHDFLFILCHTNTLTYFHTYWRSVKCLIFTFWNSISFRTKNIFRRLRAR